MPSVLVTGAAHRLGRAIAVTLAQHGYDLRLHYYTRKQEALETERLCRSYGVEASSMSSLSRTTMSLHVGMMRETERARWVHCWTTSPSAPRRR